MVTSKSDNLHEGPRLDFDVLDFFTFGSPLAIVLAFRKILTNDPRFGLWTLHHGFYLLFHCNISFRQLTKPGRAQAIKYCGVVPDRLKMFDLPGGDQ